MLDITIKDLAQATAAQIIAAGSGRVSGKTVIDSREVEPGALFVAFKGERSDGNRYARAAIDAGASAVVLSDAPEEGLAAYAEDKGAALLRAADDDCESFLIDLSAWERDRHPEWLVVGVTGSVGKTTTKDMLAATLSPSFRTHATKGNYNNLIGMPLTLLNAPEGTEALVLEMGMDGLGQISRMSRAARPALAVITNVGVSHLVYLGTREGIACAKAEIIEGMEAWGSVGPALVLTSANDYTDYIVRKFAIPANVMPLTVGTRPSDDVRQTDLVIHHDARTHAELAFVDGGTVSLDLPIPGTSAVLDAMLALSVARLDGVDAAAAAEALSSMELTAMRLDVRTSPSGVRVIDDTYNASPASMASSLSVLASMGCTGRRYAILGEMLDLGEDEVQMHACVGAFAAALDLDMIVCVGGPLARAIAEGARTVGFSEDALLVFDSVSDALTALVPVLCEGDVVLAKASRASGLDAFVKGVLA